MHFQRPLAVLAISLFMLAIVAPQSTAKVTKTQSITVVVDSDSACGSHSGSFDTVYKGTKISVNFYFNANSANPIENSLRVFKGKKEIKDWYSLLCPAPGQSKVLLSGKQVVVEGRFKNKSSFEAHKIHVMP